jgi:hypothetical protein
MSAFVLENDLLRAEFDPKTGSLTALTSRATGWPIHRRPELGRSFRLLVPLPDRRNNPVFGEKQSPPKAAFDAAARRLTFTWDGLVSEHGGKLDIAFSQTIALTPEGLSITAEVTNRSPYVVESVGLSCLGDLSLPPGSDHLDRLVAGYCGGDRAPLFPKFASLGGYYGFDYPIQMSPTPGTPLVLIDSGREGLYAGYHDTTARHLVMFTFELKPGWDQTDCIFGPGKVPTGDAISGLPVHVEFYATHFPYVNPGESDTLAPIVLAPYVGSWHRGADYYRRWKKTWHTPPRAPQWAREVHSWQQIHINSPEDELSCRYTDLVKYGEDCAKHGVEAIQLVGWNNGGQDRGNPSHDTDPRLGTPEDLKAAIAAIGKLGVKTILFNKYTWADRSLPWFREELHRYATKDPYGDCHLHAGYTYQTPTQLADINTRRFSPMCQLSAQWRAIADREFKKSIDLGAAGMLYDECQHHGPARLCFDPTHGHHVPAHVFQGDAALAEGFRRITETSAPDYLFGGEACYDLEHRHYALSYARLLPGHIPLQRYLAPDTELMVGVVGHDDRSTINQCLLFRYVISYEPRNFKGRLEEFPLTLEYGKRVDALRRKLSDRLWHANFCDTIGAAVTVKGKPHTGYTVFRQRETGKRAVVVANFDAEKSIAVTVVLDEGGSVATVVTPEKPKPRKSTGAGKIPPRSVAVFLEG